MGMFSMRPSKLLWQLVLNPPRRNRAAYCCKWNHFQFLLSRNNFNGLFHFWVLLARNNLETRLRYAVKFSNTSPSGVVGAWEFEVDPPSNWGDPSFRWADQTRARGSSRTFNNLKYDIYL